MVSLSEKVRNNLEIAGNALIYSVPGLGHYLHYQKLKNIETAVHDIFAQKRNDEIDTSKLREQLVPLRQSLDRLRKAQMLGFWPKIALWIVLWIFVFTSAFTLIGIVVDNFILSPNISGFREKLEKEIDRAAINERVALAIQEAGMSWEQQWTGEEQGMKEWTGSAV